MSSKKHRLPRIHIHREGRNIIVGLILIIFILNIGIYFFFPHWILAITSVLCAMLLVFVTYFFRNPVRVLDVDDPDFIIAPADGVVVVAEPTFEEDYLHAECLQVSIFMSPFNVHANWYPIEGEILLSEHQKGRHMGAWLPKSSRENERSLVVLKTPSEHIVVVRQIAGAMARRVVTYAQVGKRSHRNEHLGFIKFGSRVDMYLPLGTQMFVAIGEAVRGNDTIVAKLPISDDVTEPLKK